MNVPTSPRTRTETGTDPETGCCPRFDPSAWDDKEVHWKDKPFLKEHVHSLFHLPVDMAKQVNHGLSLLEGAGRAPESRGLMLCDERSPWGSDLFIETTGPVPGATMVYLSGTFLTRVYEGPFRDAPKWMEDMRRYALSRGHAVRKTYLAYTTCPRCAKAYGKNYVIAFAEVDPFVSAPRETPGDGREGVA